MTDWSASRELSDHAARSRGGAASRLCASRERQTAREAPVQSILARAGLRPTRQRVVLGGLLFDGEHRHVTADELFREAADAGFPLSGSVQEAFAAGPGAHPVLDHHSAHTRRLTKPASSQGTIERAGRVVRPVAQRQANLPCGFDIVRAMGSKPRQTRLCCKVLICN